MPWWHVTTIRKTLQEGVGAEFPALVSSNPGNHRTNGRRLR